MESKDVFESIFNSSNDAILCKTLDGKIISWNPAAKRIFGYDAEEIINKNITLLIPNHLRNEETTILEKISKGEYIKHYETERIRKDGASIFVSLTISPLKDTLGNIIGASKIIQDITDKKKTELTLRNSTKEVSDYKLALDQAAIVAITDHKGIIQHVNDNFCTISKYSREELIGQDHRIINSGFHSKEFIKSIWTTIASGKIWKGELKNKAKDGTIYWVDTTIVPFLNDLGKPYQYLAIRSDITDRKLTEEKLKRSEEKFRYTFDHMLEGIQILDFNWRYTYVNNALVQDSYYSREELIGNTLMDKYPGVEKSNLFKVLTKCMNERVSEQFENKFSYPDGTTGDFELSIQPVPEGLFILSINISKRKQAEEKQKASEIYYHSVVEQASDMIYIVDSSEKPKFIDMNQSGCNMLGYTKEEILQLTTYDIIFETDYSNSASKIEDLRSGKSVRIERKLRKKDGSAIEIEASAKKLEDGNIMVVARDISERKLEKEKLAANEKRFRALVENNYDIISLIDENFHVIYRSPSATRIMGWSDTEMLQIDGRTNVHPDDREYAANLMMKAKASAGKPIHASFRRQHKDGHYVWIEGFITNLLHDEQIKAYVTNFRDITEHKAAEERLQLSELYYRSIIERATDMIYITDTAVTGKFIDINPSGCKMLGYTKEEFLKLKPADIIFEEDLDPTKTKNLKLGDELITERLLKRKDGTAVEIESSGKMLENGNFIVFARDITERKRAEKEIIALNESLESRVKERTQELEAFSYSVSHDLRAPLRAVNGYAQMLNEDYGSQLNEEGNRILHNIKYNAVKMGTLIDDLLAFSRLGRKEVQRRDIDLNEMLEAIVIDLNKTKDHHTIIKFNDLHIVKADYGLLYQAIFNLVANSIKYSSKKENPTVEITSKELHGEVIISIKDNGAGFDMKYADKLFGVFQRIHSQEEFEGTGVGLAIVQRVIAKHNGRIWAEAKVNQGATFYISLNNN
jgi:PAS domain S-box-containing protein